MLIGIILMAALVWAMGAILTAVYIWRAPEGYEDESGFHVVSNSGRGQRTGDHGVIVGIAEDFG